MKRTLFAIDLSGKQDKYEDIFDIPYWKSVKDNYIVKVVSNRNENAFYGDLYDLMNEVGYTPFGICQKRIENDRDTKNVTLQGNDESQAFN